MGNFFNKGDALNDRLLRQPVKSDLDGELGIKRSYIETRAGNMLQIFYNPTNDLLTVDLCTEEGGSEIVRMRLNESGLLEHLS